MFVQMYRQVIYKLWVYISIGVIIYRVFEDLQQDDPGQITDVQVKADNLSNFI